MRLMPIEFVSRMHELFGQQGDEWVQTLPALLERSKERFGIQLAAPSSNLSYNLVLDAFLHDGKPAVLKIGFLKDELIQEAEVLKACAGHGVVQLLDADDQVGALLLERVQPGTPLSEIDDDAMATDIFCQVFEVFHRNARTSKPLKTMQDHFSALERYQQDHQNCRSSQVLSTQWVDRAQECLVDLIDSTKAITLLHGDLHHENILRQQENEWIIIDPKGLVGDLHFDVIQYLLNYDERGGDPFTVLSRRIDQISQRLGLDAQRIARWGIARGVLEACWIIESGRNDWSVGVELAERFAKYLG